MTRGRIRRAAPVLLTLALVAGCGVPTDTEVRADGPPPGAEPQRPGRAEPPPGPDDASDEDELVEYFLQAGTDPATAVEVLRDFIHTSEREQWQPDPQVHVVRIEDLLSTPGDQVRYDLTVRRIGQLGLNGVVEPRAGSQDERFTFSVTSERVPADGAAAAAERFRIVDPPPFILLDDRALERHFQQRPVYFWDRDQRELVPDLRWLPLVLPESQRPQTVVQWLVDGPVAWLSGSVDRLPDGLELEDNAVWEGDTLVIRLTAPHDDEADLALLEAQLWWALRPDLRTGTEVSVVVGGEERRLSADYRSYNPAVAEPPASFAVLDGEILPYSPVGSGELPALAQGPSTDIDRAAVTRDGTRAALVRVQADGRHRLTVTGPEGTTETGLVADEMGRPVWLNNPPGSGLIAADGALYQFTTGETADRVTVVEPTGVPEPVTAVAAAPDGRRIGLVAAGELYIASVVRAGDVISVDVPRRLPTTATDLDGVAFIREDWLAVVGSAGNRRRLFELTVDGALERELPGGDLGAPSDISNVVAYPANPMDPDPEDRGTIMYEADEQVWRYAYAQPPALIDAADLLGEAPTPDANIPNPRAPFFLD